MGQVQSQGSDANMEPVAAKPNEESSPPSMESLMAEAAAFGNEDENASLDAKAQKALECPCLDDLRKGPCGGQFSGAFLCFLKSTAEEKVHGISTRLMGIGMVFPCISVWLRGLLGWNGKLIPINQGSDCVHPFVALQSCIKANPGAFSKDILEDEEVVKEEKPTQQHKVIPPIWAVENKQKPVPKL